MEGHDGGRELELVRDRVAGLGDEKILGGAAVVPRADPEAGWVGKLVCGDDARTERAEGVRFGEPEIAAELLIAAGHDVDPSIAEARSSSLADASAIALFAHASQVGSISIAAAVSATFPLVVIAGGLLLFHERPSPRQWLGVLGAITGLILLGLGR